MADAGLEFEKQTQWRLKYVTCLLNDSTYTVQIYLSSLSFLELFAFVSRDIPNSFVGSGLAHKFTFSRVQRCNNGIAKNSMSSLLSQKK